MIPNEDLVAQRSLIIYIDIYRIEQVIRNLITNAVRETNSFQSRKNLLNHSFTSTFAVEVYSERWRS